MLLLPIVDKDPIVPTPVLVTIGVLVIDAIVGTGDGCTKTAA